MPEPKQTKHPKLTLKETTFLNNLKENNFNQTQTYLQTYPNAGYNTARNNGSEVTKKILAKTCTEDLIALSESVLNEFLRSKKDKLKDKASIAAQLKTKSMLQKSEVTATTDVTLNEKQYIRGILLDTPSN